MTRIGRKFICAVAAASFLGLNVMDVQATRFTEQAQFWLSADPVGPAFTPAPITAIELNGSSGGGGLYTNTYSPAGGSSVVINTVGVNKLVTFTSGTGQVVNPDGTKAVYVIYALSGVATPNGDGTGADAIFSIGQAIVIEFDEALANFDPKNPASWQFNAAGTNVLGIYNLAPQETVQTGVNGDDIGVLPASSIPAQNTNFSAINTQEASLSQGVFLFDFAGNGTAHPDDATQDFHVTLNPEGLPGTEGLIVFSNHSNFSSVNAFTYGDGGTPGVVDTSEDFLNSIFNTLLGSNFSDNSIPGLSTFLITANGSNGDFYTELDINANPTSSAIVPEPATAALGLMALAGLALRGRRRQNV